MDLRVRLNGYQNGLNSIAQSLRKHMIQSIIQNHGWRNVFYTVNRYNKRSVTLWLHKCAGKYKNVLLFTHNEMPLDYCQRNERTFSCGTSKLFDVGCCIYVCACSTLLYLGGILEILNLDFNFFVKEYTYGHLTSKCITR